MIKWFLFYLLFNPGMDNFPTVIVLPVSSYRVCKEAEEVMRNKQLHVISAWCDHNQQSYTKLHSFKNEI